MNRKLIMVMLAIFCLAALLMIPYTRSAAYDPWGDVSGPTLGVPDGTINMRDINYLIQRFNTFGTPIDRSSLMSIEYDSGWINITDMRGQVFPVAHNLNIYDWNESIMVDILYRRTPTSPVQRLNTGAPSINRTYGGTSEDVAFRVFQTNDGGYALAGNTYSLGAGSFDMWLVRTDPSGTALWNRTYGGTDIDGAFSAVQTSDGGYALAGVTASFGAGGKDMWLVKTDGAGNMQWNKTYGGTNDDEAYSVIQTLDGGYALGGYTASFGAGGKDMWLVKTDGAGNMQWNKTYGGTNDDEIFSITRTNDGGYALTGYTYSLGAGAADTWLVKTDGAGNMQWSRTYGGTNGDASLSVVQTIDGGYTLGGYTYSFGAGGSDMWLVKTDGAGNMLWNRTYGGASDFECARSVVQTIDGGYALTGWVDFSGVGYRDMWLVKTDGSGNMQWSRIYGGANDDGAYSVVQTSDGGYALAGWAASFGSGGYDMWLVRTDVQGDIAWSGPSVYVANWTPNTIDLYRSNTNVDSNYIRIRISIIK